jgi:hypothetical protein
MCLNGTRGKADIKDYEIACFESGFEVLQISSEKLCKLQGAADPLAAVAMCVEVGSFSDPDIAQGLAHFLGKNIAYHIQLLVMLVINLILGVVLVAAVKST